MFNFLKRDPPEPLQVGDRVVARRKIKLINGNVHPCGTTGRVIRTPSAGTSIHVQFDGEENACALMRSSVKKAN